MARQAYCWLIWLRLTHASLSACDWRGHCLAGTLQHGAPCWTPHSPTFYWHWESHHIITWVFTSPVFHTYIYWLDPYFLRNDRQLIAARDLHQLTLTHLHHLLLLTLTHFHHLLLLTLTHLIICFCWPWPTFIICICWPWPTFIICFCWPWPAFMTHTSRVSRPWPPSWLAVHQLTLMFLYDLILLTLTFLYDLLLLTFTHLNEL